MNILEILLEQNIIIKERQEELYYKIKTQISPEIQKFIKDKLGYKLIVNPYIIKLEKIPGKPNKNMGINEFVQTEDYIFLCLVCMYLETKDKNEQFILSQLIDYIKNVVATTDSINIEIDFNLRMQRNSMARVLKFVKAQGFIKLYDGSEEKFQESIENDILYEATGISKYFIRLFHTDILNVKNHEEIIKNEELGLEQDMGSERTKRIYRRLLLEPIMYTNENSLDYGYIKTYRNAIQKDLEKYLEAELQTHKTGAYMLVDSNNYKNIFPSTRALSDIALFTATIVREKYENGELTLKEEDLVEIEKSEFTKIVKIVQKLYGYGFSKEYREKPTHSLEEEIVKYMEEFGMIEEKEDTFHLMPFIFKFKAKYEENKGV